jgi:hypothetical protein
MPTTYDLCDGNISADKVNVLVVSPSGKVLLDQKWSDSAKFGIIDWVFTNVPEKIDVSYYRFCNDFNMFYSRWTGGKLQMYMPSDHPAIYCEFSFKD